MATLLAPTSGYVEVDGVDLQKDPIKVREKIGYMPDFFGVYDNLKVMEYLDFYGSAYGIEYASRRIADDLLELVDLSDKKGCICGYIVPGYEAAAVSGPLPDSQSPAAHTGRTGIRHGPTCQSRDKRYT